MLQAEDGIRDVAVTGVQTCALPIDLGFKLPSKVKMKMFKDYDLALLGDIHKRQFINKEETIAYCGSLIQQNHGEEIGRASCRERG